LGGTAAVGSFPEGTNRYGLADAAGNVLEFCADWHDRYYYHDSPERDPAGPEHGRTRILRGGAWFMPVDYCTTTLRLSAPPGERGDFGFRLARDEHPETP
jgi:formylglycine-generating enzyme required for sulfatase activity